MSVNFIFASFCICFTLKWFQPSVVLGATSIRKISERYEINCNYDMINFHDVSKYFNEIQSRTSLFQIFLYKDIL